MIIATLMSRARTPQTFLFKTATEYKQTIRKCYGELDYLELRAHGCDDAIALAKHYSKMDLCKMSEEDTTRIRAYFTALGKRYGIGDKLAQIGL